MNKSKSLIQKEGGSNIPGPLELAIPPNPASIVQREFIVFHNEIKYLII